MKATEITITNAAIRRAAAGYVQAIQAQAQAQALTDAADAMDSDIPPRRSVNATWLRERARALSLGRTT